MTRWFLHLVLLSACIGFTGAEPDYCKRGVKISESYQHCFEEAHFQYPYPPLHQHHDILDGCMVEAYANHTCRVVKPAALECFRRSIRRCDYRERLFAIADESGGACFGSHINREFKEHVLDFLQPVRADSNCFVLGDRAYECYSEAGQQMEANNPGLQLLTIDEFIPVADKFFDTIYNCFIRIYKSNRAICENWQIPLLLELQGTALPSLFGMTFTADQMDRLELHRGCPVHHWGKAEKLWRICYNKPDSDKGHRPSILSDEQKDDSDEQEQQKQQKKKQKKKKKQNDKKKKKKKKNKKQKQQKKKKQRKQKRPKKPKRPKQKRPKQNQRKQNQPNEKHSNQDQQKQNQPEENQPKQNQPEKNQPNQNQPEQNGPNQNQPEQNGPKEIQPEQPEENQPKKPVQMEDQSQPQEKLPLESDIQNTHSPFLERMRKLRAKQTF